MKAVATRAADLALLVIYINGLVMTAFDPKGTETWRTWWLEHRPSVVAMDDRMQARRSATA